MSVIESVRTAAWRRLGACSLLLIAVVAVYAPTLRAPFLFDDLPGIVRNPSIQSLATALTPPVTAAGAAGRPLVNLTLACDYALFGLAPAGYHATNLLLHAAVACLLCALVRRILVRRTVPRGLAAAGAVSLALVWAVHPLLSEAVGCVIQRNEILVAGWILFTLYALVRAADTARPCRWLIAGVASGWLAALSKEVAVVLPLLALIIDAICLAGSFSQAWRSRRWFHVSLCSLWVVVGALVAGAHARAGTVGFGLGVSPWEYAVTQCRALALYLRLVFWPAPLVIDYGMPVASLADVWPVAVLIVAALAATAWAVWRRTLLGLAGAAFFLLLAPSSSFVPLTTQTIAEHRMYLPTAAVLIAVACLLERIRARWTVGLATAAAITLGLVTFARSRVYTDDLRLWTETVAAAPKNPRAHASLAGAYVARERWPEAIAAYERAVTLAPDYADAQSDYAYALLRAGRAAEAVPHAEAAVRSKPADADIAYNLGNAYLAAGEYRAAAAAFERALTLRPGFAAAEGNVGDALLKLGQTEPALAHLATAAQLQPRSPAAQRALALACAGAGRRAEAIAGFRAVVALQPGSASAHNELGLALAESGEAAAAAREFAKAVELQPDFAGAHVNLANAALAQGDGAAAAKHLADAVALVPQNASLRYNLGTLLARLGRTAEARREFEAALRLDPTMKPAREALDALR